jgi:DNA polymerase III subunit gamma/tau
MARPLPRTWDPERGSGLRARQDEQALARNTPQRIIGFPMSYQVLARKYRPQRFSDVIGQPHVTRTLMNAIEQRRIAHGYIFSGHRGIGKTTVARILAMALNCRSKDHPVPEPCGICDSCVEIREGRAVDVIEIDAATNRGIDEIRELREAARYRPARDRFKIYILDEAHQITDAAFNALLKTLEEPPGHVVFMMATTQPEDIPQTIRSRCQHFSFHAVKFDEIVGQLREIALQEKIEAEPNALAMLAEAGDGSMRDALSIMDQAIACCGPVLNGETVRQLVGTVPSEILEDVMNGVADGNSRQVLSIVDGLVTEGHSPAHFARQMVRFVRNSLVARTAGPDSPLLQVSADERARAGRIADKFSEEDLARFLQILLRMHSELGYRQEQRFHLELGLLKLVHAQRLLPVEELLSQATPVGSSTAGGASRTVPTPPARPAAAPAAPGRPQRPSPLQQDTQRKGTASENANPFRSENSTTPVVGGSTAVRLEAVAEPAAKPIAEPAIQEEPSRVPQVVAAAPDADSNAVRDHVLGALEQAGQNMLASLLEGGEWKLSGGDLTIAIPKPQQFLDMTLGPEPRRIATGAAGEAAGRPVKIKLVTGGSGSGNGQTSRTPRPAAGSARSRAAEDPVVRRMQEKFGAEIRTVIDHRDKR